MVLNAYDSKALKEIGQGAEERYTDSPEVLVRKHGNSQTASEEVTRSHRGIYHVCFKSNSQSKSQRERKKRSPLPLQVVHSTKQICMKAFLAAGLSNLNTRANDSDTQVACYGFK